MPDPTRDRWFLGTLMHFHVTVDDSRGVLSVVEQTMAEGFSPPRHVHAHEDGVIYVVEGTLAVEVGGEQRTIGAGESAFLPRGVYHTFRAQRASRIIEVTAPGGIDRFYAENGEPAERLELPEPMAPDVSRLVETAKRRDIDIIGPPLDDKAV